MSLSRRGLLLRGCSLFKQLSGNALSKRQRRRISGELSRMAIRQRAASCQPAYQARDPSFEFVTISMRIIVSILKLGSTRFTNFRHITRNLRLKRSMSSSRENSHGRHAPRDRERGEPRKRRHRSQNSKRQSREETVEDALDDFYVALPSSPAPRRMIRATEKHIDQVKLVHRDRGLAHNHIDGLFPRSPKNSS